MALPILNDQQPRQNNDSSLRDRLSGPAANDSSFRRVDRLNRRRGSRLSRDSEQIRKIESSNSTSDNIQKLQDERERAEARLTSNTNPLIPLLTQMGNQLSGIQKTLNDMNKIIRQVGKNIVDSIKALDLGVRRK